MASSAGVLRVDYAFADQGYGYADGAKEEGLAAADAVEDEEDEE